MRLLRNINRLVKHSIAEGVEALTPTKFINATKRLLNKDFMKAFSAGVALVATADGSYDEDEKEKIRAYITNTDVLEGYNAGEVLSLVQKYADTLTTDREIGEKKAYEALLEISDDEEYCDMIIKICCEIGKADGNFDDNEKSVVVNICDRLGKDKREYGL
ncbi:tellurite resistance TerB family protein [Thiorhodovibrio frisius]|uniref:Tellurite resistance protein n=2 Tax=Thiorhodovibrio frisius TaxID=631362 RepID=H8Z460_9GAMM|nr:tellurite resistance TerB family protein [Thiorhodovibrio frisius]EIC20129.1 tellurite resistance protein [Thiorhodovibrio frisius]WPL20862.1 Tellurite resistance protein [Thiorhodovibrio frisius]